MKNKLEDLRDHLFATLEALQDEEKPMALDRAKAIADVAQVLINSAKVEVDYVRATDAAAAGGSFFPIDVRSGAPMKLVR
jgi:hypothetical protein